MKSKQLGSALMITVSVCLSLTMAMAGAMPVGALMGGKNVTLDGQAPLPHTTLLSGASLQVSNGLAMVALDQGNRMVLGSETEASFMRDADTVTVSLKRGNLSLYHPPASRSFRVKVGEVTVSPAKGYQTLGQVAMLDGMLAVTATDGTLQVENGGAIQEIAQGKTIMLTASAAMAPNSGPQEQGKPHIRHIPGLPGGSREPGNQKTRNPHPKRVNRKVLIALGAAGATALVAWLIVDTTSGAAQPAVSPVAP